jgi:hypothetical protein
MSKITVKCGSHGEQPWRYTIICIGCDRVYQVMHVQRKDGRVEHFDPLCATAKDAPMVCECGGRLSGGAPQSHHTARMICSSCFVKRCAS